jgi:hypothetical protein
VDSGTAERTNRVKPTFLQLCNFSKGYHAAVVSLSHPLPGTAQLQTHSKIKHAIDPSSPARTREAMLPPAHTVHSATLGLHLHFFAHQDLSLVYQLSTCLFHVPVLLPCRCRWTRKLSTACASDVKAIRYNHLTIARSSPQQNPRSITEGLLISSW